MIDLKNANATQLEAAALAHSQMIKLADLLMVEGEARTASLARAGVAVGIESPANVMGNDKPITPQDLAALELREEFTGQKMTDWLRHFGQ